MDKEIKLKDSFKLFRRLVILIKPYWGKLIKGMSLGIIIGIFGMIIPYLTKLLIDKVYPTENFSLMHILVGGVLAVSVSIALISLIQGYFNLYINSRLSNATSLMFFNHLQHLKVRFFDEHRVGEIMARFRDVSSSLNSVNKVLQAFFVNGIYLLLVPPFLFILQWKLAIVALISIPFTVTIITLTGKILRKYWKKTSEAYADLNAYQVEMFTHIRTLKAMVLERHVYNESGKQIKNALQLQLKAGGLGQVLSLSNGILYALNTALFTWLGWTYILTNQMTLGDYIAFTFYIGYLYRPIREFVNLFSEFQQSSVNLTRMFEYLDMPSEKPPEYVFTQDAALKHILKGKIEIKNVSFGYNQDSTVLHDINLLFEPASVTSIVGPSGSGKTSLLRLLNGMENPDQGKIYFDGIPSSEIDISDLRKQIMIVWQEFSMFRGTIWDNLTIGMDNVDREIVDNAIKLARMDEHITSLPNGYDTPIAEWGASLSGGQRQRLAIARAIIRDTPIIILDESTSNIDLSTEAKILSDMFNELKNKTIIFVTHRITTAAIADKICLLEKGKIIDFGSHDELVQRSESYRNMLSSGTDRKSYHLKTVNFNEIR